MLPVTSLKKPVAAPATATPMTIESQPQTVEDALRDTYFDPKQPGSYGGLEQLVRTVHARLGGAQSLKYVRRRARDWLQSQDTYTLHKPVRHNFPRNKTVVYGIDDQWQADLVDMREWQRENRNYTFLLTCIDIFSKYAWVRPIKNKSGDTVCEALKSIFESSNRSPQNLQTDKGKEFLNRNVKALLKEYEIHHFVTENETKAAVVERFNRTLKSRMWRYFTENGNHHYLDALQQLVEAYNRTKHRTIGLAPIQVTHDKELEVWQRMYGTKQKSQEAASQQFSTGDQVRLSKAKWPFEKGYLPNWTDEVFLVKGVNHPPGQAGRTVYKLTDSFGEEIRGTFYPEELQRVKKNLEEDQFEVEKVLDYRTINGSKQAFVKWKGWPNKFNAWVDIE